MQSSHYDKKTCGEEFRGSFLREAEFLRIQVERP